MQHTFGKSGRYQFPTVANNVPYCEELETDIPIAHQMPEKTTLQIGATHLADFLKKEGGDVLSIICERDDRNPLQPYADFGNEKEHRLTLSFGLCSALVHYMKQQRAEPRSDGTFALMDAQR